jgi:hypothetical protein
MNSYSSSSLNKSLSSTGNLNSSFSNSNQQLNQLNPQTLLSGMEKLSKIFQ